MVSLSQEFDRLVGELRAAIGTRATTLAGLRLAARKTGQDRLIDAALALTRAAEWLRYHPEIRAGFVDRGIAADLRRVAAAIQAAARKMVAA